MGRQSRRDNEHGGLHTGGGCEEFAEDYQGRHSDNGTDRRRSPASKRYVPGVVGVRQQEADARHEGVVWRKAVQGKTRHCHGAGAPAAVDGHRLAVRGNKRDARWHGGRPDTVQQQHDAGRGQVLLAGRRDVSLHARDGDSGLRGLEGLGRHLCGIDKLINYDK